MIRTNTRPDQAGFEPVAIIVIVLFIAVVGFAAYKVFGLNKSDAPQSAVPAAQTTVPQTINSKSDLQQTGHVLDESQSQLDSSLNDKSLDADLNSML